MRGGLSQYSSFKFKVLLGKLARYALGAVLTLKKMFKKIWKGKRTEQITLILLPYDSFRKCCACCISLYNVLTEGHSMPHQFDHLPLEYLSCLMITILVAPQDPKDTSIPLWNIMNVNIALMGYVKGSLPQPSAKSFLSKQSGEGWCFRQF